MPANLSPEYKAAEAAFRQAREPKERLEWLREMLRTIPKHKGTDHLQADIKRRIKDLSEEIEHERKGGARSGASHSVRPEGAAQIALIGPPNSGKSSLHARLTGSGAQAAEYPFTTQQAQAGMLPYEDIHIQLVDLPAVSPEHPLRWLADALRSADGCLLVTDLADPASPESIEALQSELKQRKVKLASNWPASGGGAQAQDDDPFALLLPALLVANKADQVADPDDELRAFLEIGSLAHPAFPVSAATGYRLGDIAPWLFSHLGIVRAYTKNPGKTADRSRPFTLRAGQTVEDVARLVHKDLAQSLKYARVWGKSGIQGQHVGREHAVADGDVIELHG
ncbi:MAG: TGS domain-containing protein [Betaproteobacteria bacterium]|nr:TGS domain-containing protein [Betaproteobacteria bacterium]MBI2961562.1 TGS domain-containing protein [Betaproteobacteria bacterium]